MNREGVISRVKELGRQGLREKDENAFSFTSFNVLTLYTFPILSSIFTLSLFCTYVNMFLLTHAHRRHLGSTQALSD